MVRPEESLRSIDSSVYVGVGVGGKWKKLVKKLSKVKTQKASW